MAVTRRQTRAAIGVIAGVMVACSSTSSGTGSSHPWIAASIVDPAQWAGSTLTIRISGLSSGAESAALRLGDTTASLTRVADSIRTMTIPASLGGSYVPMLSVGGQQITLDSLHVYGYAGVKAVDAIFTDIYVWPRGGDAFVMGAIAGSTGYTIPGLALIDLDNGMTTHDSMVPAELRHGAGMSYRNGVVVTGSRTSGDSVELWQVFPSPHMLGDVSEPGFSDWGVVELGPSSWMQVSKYYVQTSATCVYALQPKGVDLSPGGDIVAVRADAWV
jgi:hypothetical protein